MILIPAKNDRIFVCLCAMVALGCVCPVFAQRIGVMADEGHEATATIAEDRLGNVEGIEIVDRQLFGFVDELAAGDGLKIDSQIAADGLLRFMNVTHENATIPAVSLTIINPGAMIVLELLTNQERRDAYADPVRFAELGLDIVKNNRPRLQSGNKLIPVTVLSVDYRVAELSVYLQEARLRQIIALNLLRNPLLAVSDRERIRDFAWDTMFTSGSSGEFWEAAWLLRVTVKRTEDVASLQADINLHRSDGSGKRNFVIAEHKGTLNELAEAIADVVTDALTGEHVRDLDMDTGSEVQGLAARAAAIRVYDPARAAELAEAAWIMGHRRYINGRIMVEARLQRLIGQKLTHFPDSRAQPPYRIPFKQHCFRHKYGSAPSAVVMAEVIDELCDLHREVLRNLDEVRRHGGWWWTMSSNPYIIGLAIQSQAHTLGLSQDIRRQMLDNAVLLSKHRDHLLGRRMMFDPGREWFRHLHLVAQNADDYMDWIIQYIEEHLNNPPLDILSRYPINHFPAWTALLVLFSNEQPPGAPKRIVVLSDNENGSFQRRIQEYRQLLLSRDDIGSKLSTVYIEANEMNSLPATESQLAEMNFRLENLLEECFVDSENRLRLYLSFWSHIVRTVNKDRENRSRLLLKMHLRALQLPHEFYEAFFVSYFGSAYILRDNKPHRYLTDEDLYLFFEAFDKSGHAPPPATYSSSSVHQYFDRGLTDLAARLERPHPFPSRRVSDVEPDVSAIPVAKTGNPVFYYDLIEKYSAPDKPVSNLSLGGICRHYMSLHDVNNMLVLLLPIWNEAEQPETVRLPEPANAEDRLYYRWLMLLAVNNDWLVMRAASAFPGRGLFFVYNRNTGEWHEYLPMDAAGHTENRIGMPVPILTGMYRSGNLISGNMFYDGRGRGLMQLDLLTGAARLINHPSQRGALEGIEHPRSSSSVPLNSGEGKISLVEVGRGGRQNPDLLEIIHHTFDADTLKWQTVRHDISQHMDDILYHHNPELGYKPFLNYGGQDVNYASFGRNILLDTITGELREYPLEWREGRTRLLFMHRKNFRPSQELDENGQMKLAVPGNDISRHEVAVEGLHNPRELYSLVFRGNTAVFYTDRHYQVLDISPAIKD